MVEEVRPTQCDSTRPNCAEFDALVFVHGIYGSKDTFQNPKTKFYWPAEIPAAVAGRRIDVYTIEYQTALLNWAKSDVPEFAVVANDIFNAMSLVRNRNYRSIGFVTHSLGGNITGTYLLAVKTRIGHIARAQHAYSINLATPATGSGIANIGSTLKSVLGMSDNMLESLKSGNLYLKMLQYNSEGAALKGKSKKCRPTEIFGAYETVSIAGNKVVAMDSALANSLFSEAPTAFPLNHINIAKPKSREDPLYKWVYEKIENQMRRLNDWERPLCEPEEISLPNWLKSSN